jgi:hypothetical protein
MKRRKFHQRQQRFLFSAAVLPRDAPLNASLSHKFQLSSFSSKHFALFTISKCGQIIFISKAALRVNFSKMRAENLAICDLTHRKGTKSGPK